MRKNRILFVSHESGIGGSTVSLISLIRGLQEDEVEVEVLIPNSKGDAQNILSKYNIPYKKMLYRRNYKKVTESYTLKYRIFDLLNIIAIPWISYYIKKGKYNIVCSNSSGVSVGAGAAKLARVPHIYYVREMMDIGCNCEYRKQKQVKRLLENSEYIVFVSKIVENYHRRKYEIKEGSTFYNGFIFEDYYVDKHEILGLESPINFIQVGNFSDHKGTMNTIELLYRLRINGIDNWTMEFVGSGQDEYVEKMKELIKKYNMEKQIKISGFCEKISKKLSKKDVVIINSNAEGFGRVAVEGMLAGCLVMGKNVGGIREIIENSINGILFETSEEFFNIALDIQNNRDKYKEVALKGQQSAEERFHYRKTAKNFKKIIDDLVQKNYE